MLTSIIKIIAGLIIVAIIIGVVLTIRAQSGAYEKQFLAGTIPSSLPDGFYKGSADFNTLSWQGKKFDAAHMSGDNVFAAGSSTMEKYPFILGSGDGLRDKNLKVVTLDYNRPENPFWLRPTLDEMVEIAPGEFLGKMHYRLIPFFPFAIGYFKMTK